MFLIAHLLTALLVSAKVFNKLDASWWFVLAPSIVAIFLQLCAILVVLIVAAWASK